MTDKIAPAPRRIRKLAFPPSAKPPAKSLPTRKCFAGRYGALFAEYAGLCTI